jgi:enamine deaminase RidA (YjgF/YER057c/UK114 family)
VGGFDQLCVAVVVETANGEAAMRASVVLFNAFFSTLLNKLVAPFRFHCSCPRSRRAAGWRLSIFPSRGLSMQRHLASVLAACAVTATLAAAPARAADYLGKSEFQQQRAFSPAVITRGGRTVWLAGQTATVDESGKDISGNFEAQARTVFAALDKTLKGVGGSLQNMVTMTVFIKEPRYGDRLVQLRKEMFPSGNFPGSALITVSNFARPGMEIEIQGVAVIGDDCVDSKSCK